MARNAWFSLVVGLIFVTSGCVCHYQHSMWLSGQEGVVLSDMRPDALHRINTILRETAEDFGLIEGGDKESVLVNATTIYWSKSDVRWSAFISMWHDNKHSRIVVMSRDTDGEYTKSIIRVLRKRLKEVFPGSTIPVDCMKYRESFLGP